MRRWWPAAAWIGCGIALFAFLLRISFSFGMSSDGANRGSGFGLPLTATRRLEPGLTFDVAYEEHGLLGGPLASGLAVGQRMHIVPNHACGVTNMWSRVYVVDGEEVVADWAQVARH